MSLGLEDRTRDAQELAADPRLSAFVTANAGSGKTKTLIDRVARLLLAKAPPETILCVTYTKAAAAEMQRRLYDLLGDWSVAPDAKLRDELGKLQSRPAASFDARQLSEARSLFAAALETPGGLKIQTIHAFCEKLLRRFPLEAEVSPGFRVMDDSDAAAVAAAARRMVARHVLDNPGREADAYTRLSVALDFGAFEQMFARFESERGALGDFFAGIGGLEAALGWVWRAVDVTRGTTPEAIGLEAMAAADPELYRWGAEVMLAAGTYKSEANRLLALSAAPTFEDALAAFFTDGGGGTPGTWVAKAGSLKAVPALQTALAGEQARLGAARDRCRSAQVAIDTEDALVLAYAYLAAYGVEKTAAGALDFADLIEKTRGLLAERPQAAWVLYKLDGGIDHLLLDEAQDTAPEQWEIVNALTEEYFAGNGPDNGRETPRGLFVVGDEKQSIYSFQGARPELLLHQYETQKARADGAGRRFERVDLTTSWRSTKQVLGFVDAVFAPGALSQAVQPRPKPEAIAHEVAPIREGHVGCVDVWDLEVDRKAEERQAWDTPMDLESEDSANKRLARRIAGEIKRLIEDGEAVYDKKSRQLRPAHAGDVLILVRRRKALFEEILRALKQAGLPVAGADRLALSSHIIFDDLLAVARFVLFPTDELTLAALLKSPLCGLDDDSLYDLAHGRGDENLWTRLQAKAEARDDWRHAAAVLAEALALARTARPYELYARLLGWTGADGRTLRQRLLTRLGGEAEDALDEFLNQVLAAEARGAHDLESLTAILASLDIEVKRELDVEREEVRVMTAHGAKGLEAPIVFLPETTLPQSGGSPLLRHRHDGVTGFLWCNAAKRDCPATAAARERRTDREAAEAYRLLYVALTRARDRLVICGRLGSGKDPAKLEGWWGAVRDAVAGEGLADQMRELTDASGKFRRFGDDPQKVARVATTHAADAALPDWARVGASPEAFARYASPSDLGEGAVAAAASPLAQAGGLGRFRRGDLIHRLLQLLPDLPAADRATGAARLLAREVDLTEAQRAEMAAAALGVLADARFAEVFGPGSRAEVAVAGGASALPPGLKISGRIDRLVVLPDRVLVVDFKTNRPSPDRIEDADPAYLRQMALYAGVLADLFPGRSVEAAIVWTDGPKLMPVPENLIVETLAELRRAG